MNRCASSQKTQINCQITHYRKKHTENYSSSSTSPRCQNSCFWSPWQQCCWSHYCFHTVCNREVFQRAPFIVQITNGTFMPPDKWQMIFYPDSTETTHLSWRYTHHKHTADVSGCVSACCWAAALYLLQLLAVVSNGGGDAGLMWWYLHHMDFLYSLCSRVALGAISGGRWYSNSKMADESLCLAPPTSFIQCMQSMVLSLNISFLLSSSLCPHT